MVTAANNNKEKQHNHQSSMADDYDGLDDLHFMSKKLPETSQKSKRSNNTNSSFSNFSSLPCFDLKWGSRKQLRCIKQSHHDNHDLPSSSSFSRSTGDNDNGGKIEAVTEKLIMLDFRAEVQQINAGFLQKPEKADSLKKPGAVETKAWNLRTRRAVRKESDGVNGGERKPGFVPTKKNSKEINGVKGGGCGVQEGRAKFSVPLSKKEIVEDYLVFTGKAPPKKPKKRPRNVQKEINVLLPGFRLTEITANMYKVNDESQSKKR